VPRLLAASALFLMACGAAGGGPCAAALPPDQVAGTAGCLRLAIAPDSRTYSPGMATIDFTLTATNVSAQPCAGSGQLLCGGPELNVRNLAGGVVWHRTRPAIPCPMLIRLLQPGQTMTSKLQWQSPNLSPGVYTVTGSGGVDLGRAYFSVC
jgi:hypothetical protein